MSSTPRMMLIHFPEREILALGTLLARGSVGCLSVSTKERERDADIGARGATESDMTFLSQE